MTTRHVTFGIVAMAVIAYVSAITTGIGVTPGSRG